jgi:peptidyl-prolyl cis-trans isomerase D
MTMLDRMRRHRGWLKWSLGIVVIGLILFYVPQFLGLGASGASPSDALATVNGRSVTKAVFDRIYDQRVTQMRASYGDISDDLLKQLGVGQQVLEQLINQQAIIAEANRLGLSVSDGELRERLVHSPTFLNDDGVFVGEERYRQILDSARPPMRPDEFEQQFRESLLGEKLEAAVTGWVRVSDADVEREYRRRNEKVKLDVAAFTAAEFKAGIQPTDAEIAAQFAASPDKYKVPEKRHVRFLAVDAQAFRAKMTVTPDEVKQRYQDNIQTYSTPEQVRASHILFKTQGKDDAAVKKLAETVLAKAKAGGDFAALAKQYSDDDSKDKGGDLDYFSKGIMVKEFEDAAWAMKPGEISGLVKSQFGYHIIKVTDHRAAMTKTLDDVRTVIEDQIRLEKAQAEAAKAATDIGKEIKTAADLDRVAKEHGLTVGDSGLFARDEPIAGLGFSDAVAAEAFSLEANKVSGAIATPQGTAFIALVEVKPAHAPTLDEVHDKVRDDVINTKAVALAAAKASTMAKAAHGGNFAAAAKAQGVEAKTTDLITRGSSLPGVGISDKVDAAAFTMKKGDTSDPIATDTAVVVVQVMDRQDVTPAGLDSQRDSLRSQLLQQQRDEFFGAYMLKARKKMKIEYNEAVLKTVLG